MSITALRQPNSDFRGCHGPPSGQVTFGGNIIETGTDSYRLAQDPRRPAELTPAPPCPGPASTPPTPSSSPRPSSSITRWLTADPSASPPSLGFIGHPAYGPAQLRQDLDRFTFLLGGDDGEELFGRQ